MVLVKSNLPQAPDIQPIVNQKEDGNDNRAKIHRGDLLIWIRSDYCVPQTCKGILYTQQLNPRAGLVTLWLERRLYESDHFASWPRHALAAVYME